VIFLPHPRQSSDCDEQDFSNYANLRSRAEAMRDELRHAKFPALLVKTRQCSLAHSVRYAESMCEATGVCDEKGR